MLPVDGLREMHFGFFSWLFWGQTTRVDGSRWFHTGRLHDISLAEFESPYVFQENCVEDAQSLPSKPLPKICLKRRHVQLWPSLLGTSMFVLDGLRRRSAYAILILGQDKTEDQRINRAPQNEKRTNTMLSMWLAS